MNDPTLHIKNLSIALEALSRINTIASFEHFKDIEGLLAQEIFAFRKEKEQKDSKAARSAEPTPDLDDFNPFTKA